MSRALRIPIEGGIDLIGVGEGMVELWADEPLGQAKTLQRSYGGDVLNTLIMSARLGNRVGFVSKVGDDPFGTALLEHWLDEGVDVSNCPLVPGNNGVYFISLLRNGEREFSYRRQGSAASTLSTQDLNEAYLAVARVLLLSGITQAISEEAQAATLKAAELARKHGVAVAFDPNYRTALWTDRAAYLDHDIDGIALARQALAEIMPLVDILLPSFPSDNVLWHDERLTTEVFAEACIDGGAPLVGIKLGDAGAYILHEAQRVHVQAISVDPVADTTGAGDAWNAGFLHGLMAGQEPSEAAASGNHVAAWKLRYRGAIPPKGSKPPQEARITMP